MARRVLSQRISAIEYTHADDGKRYRHDFKRGAEIDLNPDGSLRVKGDKKLWALFEYEGRQQPFLVNTPKGATVAQSFGKRMAALRRKKSRTRPATTRRRKRSTTRRRRASVALVNPPKRRGHKRRRLALRRNPPRMSVKGALGVLMDGALSGLAATGGKGVARLAAAQFPFADGSMMDVLAEIGAAVAIGLVAPGFIGEDMARFAMAGAFMAPIEDLIQQINSPTLTSLFGATLPTDLVFLPADTAAARLSGYTSNPQNGLPTIPLAGYTSAPRQLMRAARMQG